MEHEFDFNSCLVTFDRGSISYKPIDFTFGTERGKVAYRFCN